MCSIILQYTVGMMYSDNVVVISLCLILPNASAKSIDGMWSFVLMCLKSSNTVFRLKIKSCLFLPLRKALCQNSICGSMKGKILFMMQYNAKIICK